MWPHFPKLWLLRCQIFSKFFSPEAGHRCIWQHGRAPSRSYSSSSRPKRPWMRRTTWAVASDEKVDEMLIASWLADNCIHFFFCKVCQKQMHQHLVLFFVFATGSFPTPRFAFENKDFRVGLFLAEGSCRALVWHAHHTPSICV